MKKINLKANFRKFFVRLHETVTYHGIDIIPLVWAFVAFVSIIAIIVSVHTFGDKTLEPAFFWLGALVTSLAAAYMHVIGRGLYNHILEWCKKGTEECATVEESKS